MNLRNLLPDFKDSEEESEEVEVSLDTADWFCTRCVCDCEDSTLRMEKGLKRGHV